MKKRGQITVFIIIGIILLLAIIVFLQIRKTETISSETEAKESIPITFEKLTFDKYVQSCIEKKLTPAVKLMAEFGGTLYIDDYRPYEGISYRYFLKYDSCDANIISKEKMQLELNSYLENNIMKCLDFKEFIEQKFKIEFQNGVPEPMVSTTIASDEVIVKLELPFKVSKEDRLLEFKEFIEPIKLPLGSLYDLAMTIANEETDRYYFDKDQWMVNHGSEIQIEKHKPYPDTIYSLRKRSDIYGFTLFFNFGIKGKDIISNPGSTYPKTSSGKYFYKCYKDTPSTVFSGPNCEGGCKSCTIGGTTIPHGSSWCNYDGTTEPGKAQVGSRHYLLSCNNGEFYTEECTDYRIDICVEGGKPRCRPNRWQNCINAMSEGSCEAVGDCYWYDYLDIDFDKENSPARRAPIDPDKLNGNICNTQSATIEKSKCVPIVPPGLKFWESSSKNYCNMANALTMFYQPTFEEITSINIPNYWTEYEAAHCFFIGDCGNYNNIAGILSRGGYWNLDLTVDNSRGSPYEFIDYSTLNIPPNRLTLSSDVYNYQTASYSPIVAESDISDYMQNYFNLGIQWRDGICEDDMCGSAPFDCDDFCCILGVCAVEAPAHTDINCLSGSYDASEVYKDFKKWIPGASTCNPWIAPSSGDCAKCSEDPLRPCSEYKCKSLGINCNYYESGGIPRCGNPSNPNDPNYDPTPLEIIFDNSFLPQGYISTDLSFSAYGSIINGYYIYPKFNLASTINIKFNTNKDAICKLDYGPMENFYDPIESLVSISSDGSSRINHSFSYILYTFNSELNNLATALDLTSDVMIASTLNVDAATRNMINSIILAMQSDKLYVFVDCMDSVGNRKRTFFLYDIDQSANNPPIVELKAPANNARMPENITFNFTVSDDTARQLSCGLYLGVDEGGTIMNWNVKGSGFFGSGTSINNFSIDSLEAKTYIWNVKCTDGLSSTYAPINWTFTVH